MVRKKKEKKKLEKKNEFFFLLRKLTDTFFSSFLFSFFFHSFFILLSFFFFIVVNSRAVETYRHYMAKVEEHKEKIGLDPTESQVSQQLFGDLETVVKNENPRSKNVEIIQAAQRLTRSLKGGRGICCKSAKDRTSMSMTLEQAQLLFNNEAETRIEEKDKSAARLSIEDRTALYTANVLREFGIRIMNAKKNIGKKKFAFNSIQRKRLPKQYRPPRAVMAVDKVES